jgi:uncharacterized cupin superfamily protein
MKKRKLFNILILLSVTSVTFSQALTSTVYDWEKLPVKKTSNGEIRTYFNNPTKFLERFEVNAVTLNGGKGEKTFEVPKATDEMIIIKEGTAEIKVNDETKTLGEGSVVVVSAGDKVTITNRQGTNTVYYSFLMKPFVPVVHSQTDPKISPVFVDWKDVVFKPNNNGGRRDILRQATSTMKELEIHVTTLKEGINSHAPHNHPDEEFVLMRSGNADMNLDGKDYLGGPGSIFFLASMGMHGLNNTGSSACEYYAIRWITANTKPE